MRAYAEAVNQPLLLKSVLNLWKPFGICEDDVELSASVARNIDEFGYLISMLLSSRHWLAQQFAYRHPMTNFLSHPKNRKHAGGRPFAPFARYTEEEGLPFFLMKKSSSALAELIHPSDQ